MGGSKDDKIQYFPNSFCFLKRCLLVPKRGSNSQPLGVGGGIIGVLRPYFSRQKKKRKRKRFQVKLLRLVNSQDWFGGERGKMDRYNMGW